jgi:hypothetical protein
MTTPGRPETVLDEKVLDQLMSRAASRWGGGNRPCRWITIPSETTREGAAAGITPPEAVEAVIGTEAVARQPEAPAVTETPEGEPPADEREAERAAPEAVKSPRAARAKAARPARPRRAKQAEAPKPARARSTKKR